MDFDNSISSFDKSQLVEHHAHLLEANNFKVRATQPAWWARQQKYEVQNDGDHCQTIELEPTSTDISFVEISGDFSSFTGSSFPIQNLICSSKTAIVKFSFNFEAQLKDFHRMLQEIFYGGEAVLRNTCFNGIQKEKRHNI